MFGGRELTGFFGGGGAGGAGGEGRGKRGPPLGDVTLIFLWEGETGGCTGVRTGAWGGERKISF